MGLKGVMVCLLILGLVLEQVQVEGKSCCRSTLGRNCYNLCRVRGAQKLCAGVCRCKLTSSGKCPTGFPKLALVSNSDEPDTVKYCNLGCRASMCDYMVNAAADDEEMKLYLENCGDACVNFCNGDAGLTSLTA
ncbi:alpha-hordothionin [Hordeum vulgare subsp. vulgare]|nr:alpha-hordothionin [Hordeum vulgare subsp. vulgare]XP_044983593.1 alpha-hordothionin [Hordeum vulgare subsp. vulgare]XP_044983598.1 alpha-hordothionin [Hordeum vulgare subsp. vulgare]AAA32966.1 alpha-hordothionin [Hordeum vulgare subsp. vulgare]